MFIERTRKYYAGFLCSYSLEMQYSSILGIAERQVKSCFIWTSNFLVKVLQYPLYLNAASLENTCKRSQHNIFRAPPVNIVLDSIFGIPFICSYIERRQKAQENLCRHPV